MSLTTGQVADLISISAHKFGGPQGVGALVARTGVSLVPRLRGGGQERDRRSGTQNVAGIAGFAAAAGAIEPEEAARLEELRRALEEMVVEGVKTSIPLHQALVRDPDILNGDYTIKWLEEWLAKRQG